MAGRYRGGKDRPDEREPEPTPDFDHYDFQDFVERHEWTFAKTMAHMPHEWIKRARMKELGAESDFEAAVLFIRENGYQRRFGSKVYTYYDLKHEEDGKEIWRQYWTMGAPMVRTIIMNRALIHGPQDPRLDAEDDTWGFL